MIDQTNDKGHLFWWENGSSFIHHRIAEQKSDLQNDLKHTTGDDNIY